jgi:hypothetical protein
MSVRDAAPPPPVSSTPVLGGFPAAIARAGLGSVAGSGGSSTVTFGAPTEYVPFSTAPITVSRSIWDQAQSAVTDYAQDRAEGALSEAREAVTERASSALDEAHQRAQAALGGAKGGSGGDADKQFEELYDRLKRELLIEQEQLGQLFHEP